MTWEIEFSDEFRWWYEHQLSARSQELVDRAVGALIEHGPALGRPIVAEIDTSRERRPGRIHNLKELRIGQSLRVLFAFDERRVAYLILGGDKRGEWTDWYRTTIPEAERLWAEYHDELRKEGLL